MPSLRLALLLVTGLSGLVFACSAPLDPKASASRDSVTSCEPDTDVSCRCENGTSGKKRCDEDGTLGECTSHGRACGNGSDEGDGLTPTPTSPLNPGPTKPDPGAEPPAEPDEPPPPGTPPPPTGTCSAEQEPNNTNDAADGISTKRCGTLTASDEDIFWWNGAGTFEVTLTATGDADVVVWQDGGAYFANASSTRVVGTATAGDVLISVISQTQQSQSYTLTLKRP